MGKRYHKLTRGICIFCQRHIRDIQSGYCDAKRKVTKQSPGRRLTKIADEVFRHYIRARDHWTCQRPSCGKRFNPPKDLQQIVLDGEGVFLFNGKYKNSNFLHCSHFWNRNNFNARWDPLNCDAICGTFGGWQRNFHRSGCHEYWETDTAGKQQYRLWKLRTLGQAEFDALERRGNTSSTKPEKIAIIAHFTNELKIMGYNMDWFEKRHRKILHQLNSGILD